ncbi:hypothetical protein GUITHDRAFT_71408 [Guillardia theta CCMP2712]|uniref:riboflavin kinase n=1 Tax=Guillardia theta (strain CCMP2712) TaxID=905079 RepID=L1JAS6_GUITC|nr:hypothetical protein GUITHDRAFT_71408 [Guillardia theta CCMP2712]EKX45407.1 hypothetical protein GUITHDRAFT_71408 [Guillardia theta CCMP2712]|eukprot:XP_005832387.1 hypothetical protein GUITHDRAFT_71408 [Guillardia theta CCMP2712]
MRGDVASGWGRGGKKLGIPTANLPESMFADALREVQTGVYLGWAQIGGVSKKSVKAVVNVGYSPTFVGAENREKVVEAHLLEKFENDFYGKEMRLMLTGFLRPETKFDSFPELLEAIHKDIENSREALDTEEFSVLSAHPFLQVSFSLSCLGQT